MIGNNLSLSSSPGLQMPCFKRPSSFLFLILFLSSILSAQESTHGEVYRYARKIIDTLTSPSMHGRGYVNDGDKIAARYLEDQFRKMGLKTFGNSYRQEFSLDVNTFPGKMSINYYVRDRTETPGTDFLVDPACPSLKGTFRLQKADSLSIRNDQDLQKFRQRTFNNRILYLDTTSVKDKAERDRIISLFQAPPPGISGIIIGQRWLRGPNQRTPGPWDVAQTQNRIPVIYSIPLSVDSGPDKVDIDIESKLIHSYKTQNLVAFIPGSAKPDSFIVFTAHYDHLGQMGTDTYFPGANDNASGCAMLLNLAKYYSAPAHKPKYSIAFIAFSAEEAGILGSKYYTEHPLFPLKQIRFLVNMDIMGTGDEGITVVNGTLFPDEFKSLQTINDKEHFLTEVKIRGKAANSDHYFFSEKGVKAFFIYTRGGIKAYHDTDDKAATLPLTRFEDVFHLLTRFENWMETTR
jgi:aminopeptidase YwaD